MHKAKGRLRLALALVGLVVYLTGVTGCVRDVRSTGSVVEAEKVEKVDDVGNKHVRDELRAKDLCGPVL